MMQIGPSNIVLDGDTAYHGKGHSSPHFWPTLLWHGNSSQQLLSSCRILFHIPEPVSAFGWLVYGAGIYNITGGVT